jgi:ubiquinone biosynthesis protein UbiJ
MPISFKHNGGRVSSAKAMTSAMLRDIEQGIERTFQNAASSVGARTRKTSKGLEVEGFPEQMARLMKRLGK